VLQSDKSGKPKTKSAKPEAKSTEPSKAVDAKTHGEHTKAGDNASDTLFSGLADNKMLQ